MAITKSDCRPVSVAHGSAPITDKERPRDTATHKRAYHPNIV